MVLEEKAAGQGTGIALQYNYGGFLVPDTGITLDFSPYTQYEFLQLTTLEITHSRPAEEKRARRANQ